jgi:hypothetical protein
MDIKNLIILLLAAALGITSMEATGMIDLITDKHCENVKPVNDSIHSQVLYSELKEISPLVEKFVHLDTLQYPSTNPEQNKRYGVYFKISDILQMITEEQYRINSNGGSNIVVDGIVVYPYRDETNRINLATTTIWDDSTYPAIERNKNFIKGTEWCPVFCGGIK